MDAKVDESVNISDEVVALYADPPKHRKLFASFIFIWNSIVRRNLSLDFLTKQEWSSEEKCFNSPLTIKRKF